MASPSNSNHRRLLLGAALAAGLAGAGIAWWREQRQAALEGLPADASDAQVLETLWALELATPNGKKLTLSSLKGKLLLINFWATWCPPCVEELPLIDGFYQANLKNGWQVLGLAVDQLAAVNTFLGKMPISFPVAVVGSAGIEMSKSLGNLSGGLPFTVVLSAGGKVAQRKMGRITPEDLTAWSTLS
jgi:thiol-disulfide isomerase/thioredoxin